MVCILNLVTLKCTDFTVCWLSCSLVKLLKFSILIFYEEKHFCLFLKNGFILVHETVSVSHLLSKVNKTKKFLQLERTQYSPAEFLPFSPVPECVRQLA